LLFFYSLILFDAFPEPLAMRLEGNWLRFPRKNLQEGMTSDLAEKPAEQASHQGTALQAA
jgi:hypothetical protein